MSRVSFSKEQRALIVKRDQHCIVHHHNYHPDFHYAACTRQLVVHHRKGRGMGGVKSRNRVANGLLVCDAFNTRVEQDADYARQARNYGWLLRTDNEIETVPVWIPWLQRSVYLDNHGHYLSEGSHQIVEVNR